MADQDWASYADQAYLATTDTLLARTSGGGGVEVSGAHVVARRTAGGPFTAPSDFTVSGTLTSSGDTLDYRLLTANGRGWRVGHSSSGTTHGIFFIQGSTDGFVSSFIDGIFLATNGDLVLGTTLGSSLGTGKLQVRGGIIGDRSSGDGNFTIEARSGTLFSNSIYNSTTAAAANVTISGTAGYLQRSTSSLKYKTAIEPITAERSAIIYDMVPIWYRSLCATDRKDWSWYGLGAEDVAALDPRLVHWGPADPTDPDSALVAEGVMYDRIVTLLIAEVQALRDRVVALEAKL